MSAGLFECPVDIEPLCPLSIADEIISTVTFLNAMSDYIPKDERIITIEDNAELQIRGVPNLVRLEARNANLEGASSLASTIGDSSFT